MRSGVQITPPAFTLMKVRTMPMATDQATERFTSYMRAMHAPIGPYTVQYDNGKPRFVVATSRTGLDNLTGGIFFSSQRIEGLFPFHTETHPVQAHMLPSHLKTEVDLHTIIIEAHAPSGRHVDVEIERLDPGYQSPLKRTA